MKHSVGPFCSRNGSLFNDHDLIGLPADKVAETLASYDLRTLAGPALAWRVGAPKNSMPGCRQIP